MVGSYVGCYFDKSKSVIITVIWPDIIGTISPASSFHPLESIRIYYNYVFVTFVPSPGSPHIQVFKKNPGDDDYEYIASYSYQELILRDIIIKDRKNIGVASRTIVCYFSCAWPWWEGNPESQSAKVEFDLTNDTFGNMSIFIPDSDFFYRVSRDEYHDENSIIIEKLLTSPKPELSLVYTDIGPTGTYKYKIVYIKLTKAGFIGEESISVTTSTQWKGVLIESINIPTGCTAEIYRKKSTESVWKYIGEATKEYFIDDDSLSVEINISDRERITPIGKYLEVFYNMLFVIGNPDYPNYWFRSNTNNEEDFPVDGFGILHKFKIMSGMKRLSVGGADSLLMFGDAGVVKGTGYSASALYLDHFNFEITKAIHKTIRQYSDFLILQNDTDVYRFDGGRFISISDDTLKTGLGYSANNEAVVYDDKYILFDRANNRVFIYDFILEKFFREPVWIEYTNYIFSYAEVVESILYGAANQKLYKLDDTYKDVNTNIPLSIKTKQFEFGDPIIRKVLERMHIIMGGITNAFKVKLHAGDHTPEGKIFNVTTNDNRGQAIVKFNPDNGRAEFFQVEINESTKNNVSIYGVDFQLRFIRPRRNKTSNYSVT